MNPIHPPAYGADFTQPLVHNFALQITYLLSVPPVWKRVVRVAGAYRLPAIWAFAPSDRLPAFADPVLVALGAGVPPPDLRERPRHLHRLVLRHGRQEQLIPGRARREVVQRRRQEVLVPHVQEGGPEVVDDGEDGPVAAVLGSYLEVS